MGWDVKIFGPFAKFLSCCYAVKGDGIIFSSFIQEKDSHAASNLLFSAFEHVDMGPQEVEYMEPRSF